MRNIIKKLFNLYDINELQVGAHCGCCGNWMDKEIVPKENTWSVCDICLKQGGLSGNLRMFGM